MHDDEIVRWFRRFKYDPAFRDQNGSRTVPIRTLARWAGINRSNLYQMLDGELTITIDARTRLESAIAAVQGGMRFRRANKRWEVTDPRFEALPRYDRTKHRGERIGMER